MAIFLKKANGEKNQLGRGKTATLQLKTIDTHFLIF